MTGDNDMNPTSAVMTLGAGVGVSQVADIITWLATWPVHAPPNSVILTLAAVFVALGHAAVNILRAKFPTITADATPKAPPAA
jgi:hypothetical protein